MLYETLAAEARRNHTLDDVRSAALARARRLVDLLERGRLASPDAATCRGPAERDRSRVRLVATQAEIDELPAARTEEDARAVGRHSDGNRTTCTPPPPTAGAAPRSSRPSRTTSSG